KAAVAAAGQLALTRLTYLSEPEHTGLEPFLASGPTGSSGVMITEYIAAAALGRLRAVAQPVAVQSVSLSRGVEDDASFAPVAVSQLLGMVDELATVLAAELLAAVRAIRQRSTAGLPVLSAGASGAGTDSGLVPAVLASCAALPVDDHDR